MCLCDRVIYDVAFLSTFCAAAFIAILMQT